MNRMYSDAELDSFVPAASLIKMKYNPLTNIVRLAPKHEGYNAIALNFGEVEKLYNLMKEKINAWEDL